jgi:hypothetical protein
MGGGRIITVGEFGEPAPPQNDLGASALNSLTSVKKMTAVAVPARQLQQHNPTTATTTTIALPFLAPRHRHIYQI